MTKTNKFGRVFDRLKRLVRFFYSMADDQCPVCGYYCLGKGGRGCIDKPTMPHTGGKGWQTVVLRYRVRYYWRKLCNALGFCHCGSRVNWTTTGRPICPRCGK